MTVELNGHGHLGEKGRVDPYDALWHVGLPRRKKAARFVKLSDCLRDTEIGGIPNEGHMEA